MKIRDRIVVIIAEHGEWLGTSALAEALPADLRNVQRDLRQLDAEGVLIYQPTQGGRGNKSKIRKRNHNQPGLPRRVK
jgi:MarR-like DNA-binding transcriptional regulator SgrR of sgrS sRNA